MSSFKIIRKTNLFLILCQIHMEQVLVWLSLRMVRYVSPGSLNRRPAMRDERFDWQSGAR